MAQASLNSLWCKAIGTEVPPPDWVNAATDGGGRVAPAYARLIVDGDRLEMQFNREFAYRMTIGSTAAFTGLLAIVAFLAGSPGFAAFLLVLGPVTCLLLHVVVNRQSQRGCFMIIDRERRIIELPRHEVSIDFDDVQRFQWGRHRLTPGSYPYDLFVIANSSFDPLTRFYIASPPRRRQVEEIVIFSGLPLEERQRYVKAGLLLRKVEKFETDRNTA